MAFAARKLSSFFRRSKFMQYSLAHSSSLEQSLEESLRYAVYAKTYIQIPELLSAGKKSCRDRNPFAFFSTFSESDRVHTIDEILQSLIPIRPRSRLCHVYSCLLSYALECPNPFPLVFAILQCTLRSGCLPVPQTHLLLSNAWIKCRQRSQSVCSIILEMQSIGYSPDCGICNYLIQSLCKVDQLDEAVKVLRGMAKAGCIPDLDSYGYLIIELSELRMTSTVFEMVKEMVGRHELNPRQEMVVKAVDAMRANRDIWRAVEMIEFLEKEGVHVGFEAYELVLEGCLEGREFVLAGKFVMRMTERGFIPYISVRQKVFEGLLSIGELEFASVVRRRFAELNS